MSCAWVFLAFRDGTLLGAGERLEDAQQVCVTASAKRGEGRLAWDIRPRRDLLSHDALGQVVATAARYAVRRVPVARYADGADS